MHDSAPAGSTALAAVREHWEADPCAAKLSRHARGTRTFYDDVERQKRLLEPHEAAFAEFELWRGREVLEIGCGVGIDTARFARAGARVTAIDLTEAAVALAEGLLRLEGLAGTVTVANAEHLPFPDASFDLVYSWGVLHHTPDLQAATDEVRRVLRPGGEARIMLYARHSLFAVAVWGRQVLRERRPLTLGAAVSRGLESPGTKALTRAEASRLFSRFSRHEIVQLATHYDRLPVNHLGWHLLVRAGVHHLDLDATGDAGATTTTPG